MTDTTLPDILYLGTRSSPSDTPSISASRRLCECGDLPCCTANRPIVQLYSLCMASSKIMQHLKLDHHNKRHQRGLTKTNHCGKIQGTIVKLSYNNTNIFELKQVRQIHLEKNQCCVSPSCPSLVQLPLAVPHQNLQMTPSSWFHWLMFRESCEGSDSSLSRTALLSSTGEAPLCSFSMPPHPLVFVNISRLHPTKVKSGSGEHLL